MSLVSIKATVACDGCGQHMIYTLDPASVITEADLGDEVMDTIAHMLHYELPANKKHEIETVTGGATIVGIHLCKKCYNEVDERVPDDRDITEQDVRSILAI